MNKKYEVAVNLQQDFTAAEQTQGRNNIGAASASDVTALQSQVSSLSDVSAYSVKGEATVAQLNAGPSGIQAGWAYQLTDSGTLTEGTLAVVAGDTVAWDGTKWFPLVKSDYYATKTYAQNVAHSIAPEYNGSATAGNLYMHEGLSYLCKEDCSGDWDDSKFEYQSLSEKVYLADKKNSDFANSIVETSNGATYDKNSVWDEVYENQVCNENGLSAGSNYTSYGLVITETTQFYFKERSLVYCSICVFNNKESLTGGTRYRFKTNVGEEPEDNLPYEANPITLVAGQYVVFSTRKETSYNVFKAFFVNWLFIDNLSPKVPLAPVHITQVKDSIKDRLYIQKRDLSESKDIYVYVPAKVGYIRYVFHFFENLQTESNYSVWRLQWIDACKEDLTYIDHMSVSGEWECALKLKDADDFMGGSTHGDEIMSAVGFWVDGQEISFAELADGWCKEFRLARKSTMYDPTDHTTATVKHGCEYAFDLGGLTIQQSVKWLVDATVTNCYMGMNLPKKSYTTKGYIDLAIDPSGIPAYNRYPGAEKMVLWDSTTGVFNLFENLGSTIADYLGNNSLYFTDNSGNAYNKGYYCITYTTGQVEIPANTVWKSKTHYVYDVSKDLS